uniref:Uncharacterized protein n=1 Tax=Musa acuminata subsp. malaccensis TaxID=214687 RepID=A0A804IFW1_MUSAM
MVGGVLRRLKKPGLRFLILEGCASSVEEEHGTRTRVSDILEISILSSILLFSVSVPPPVSSEKSTKTRSELHILCTHLAFSSPVPLILPRQEFEQSLDLAGNRRFGSLER